MKTRPVVNPYGAVEPEEGGPSSPERAPRRDRERNGLIIFTVAAVVGVSVFAGHKRLAGGRGGTALGMASAPQAMPLVAPLEIGFEATNEYTKWDGTVGEHYPWLKVPLVEPYRETELNGVGLSSDLLEAGWTYRWTIQGGDDVLVGVSVTHQFTTVGIYSVGLEALNDRGDVASFLNGSCHCKYVRREIRTLLDEDRRKFFDASEVVFSTSSKVGQAKYGTRFHNIEYFVRQHTEMAADRMCDHMHNGLGFLPNHGAFTLFFEQALQAVDPIVTIPYWDYTIEANYIQDASNGSSMGIAAWRESEVFQDDWFGEAAPPDFVVRRGRWASTPVMTAASNFSTITNGYGFLRAPWNNNNVPFVTRHNLTFGMMLTDVPDCAAHYDQLQLTNWSIFGLAMETQPHGTVHTMIGGVWGADYVSRLQDLRMEYHIIQEVVTEAFAWQKNMWRAEIMECPSACSLDTPMTECKCSCPRLNDVIKKHTANALLGDIAPILRDSKYTTSRDGADLSESMLKMFCNQGDDFTPSIGDSLESGSPRDISFWPTHPTVDRLWQWRRINGMDDETWPNAQANSVHGSDTGYCWGHDESDVLIWRDLFGDDGDFYTSKELFDFMDPKRDASPYIYDNFRWDHCVSQGYAPNLLRTTAQDDSSKLSSFSEDNPVEKKDSP